MARDDTDGSGVWRDLLAAEIDRQKEAHRSLVRPWQVYAAIAFMVTIGMGIAAQWAAREYDSLREQQRRLEDQQRKLEQALEETRSALAQLDDKIKGESSRVDRNKKDIIESKRYSDYHKAKLESELEAFKEETDGKKLDERLRTIEEHVMEDTENSKKWLVAKLERSLKTKKGSKRGSWFQSELDRLTTAEWTYARLEQQGSAAKPGTKKDAREWFKGSLERNLGGKAPDAWFKGSLERNLGGKAPDAWFKGALERSLDDKAPSAWFKGSLERNLDGKTPSAWFEGELEASLKETKTKAILEAWVKEAVDASKTPVTDSSGGEDDEGSGPKPRRPAPEE